MNRRYRRRWIVAFWGVNGVGLAVFVLCAWGADWPVPVTEWRAMTAFAVAWIAGFWAAVLVEIATQ